MLREMYKSKLHRAVVTNANLNYEGSLTIDQELMEMADLLENEKVQVANINNGARFDTYVISGERGKREIGLNGAAARLGEIGDRVIIINYALMDDAEARQYIPKVIVLDEHNQPIIK